MQGELFIERCPHVPGSAGEGAVTMSEWHTANSGQLQSSRLVLDTAIFRALMPR